MNEQELKNMLEASLLAAGRPVSTQQLLELFEERERPETAQLLSALQSLAADYRTRGVELLEVASGWRIQIRNQYIDFVSRLWQERPARYSRALLETLALIAYRQPITRGEIEEIRGVTVSSNIMRTLHERNWIRVVGHREVPGRPEILATTKEFLDYFGLKGLEELPTLAELKDVETVGVQLEFNTGETAPAASTETADSASRADTASAASSESALDTATLESMPDEVSITEVDAIEPSTEVETAAEIELSTGIDLPNEGEAVDEEVPGAEALDTDTLDEEVVDEETLDEASPLPRAGEG